MIHLDTNFLIQATVRGSSAHQKFSTWTSTGEVLSLSSIAWSEFLCGPLTSAGEALARQVFPFPEPFLSQDAELAAHLFNQTGRRSRTLADCMIAAVAIRCGAKLATINTGDFQTFVKYGLVLAS